MAPIVQQAQALEDERAANAASSCGLVTQFINFGECIGRSVAAWIGAGLIYLSSLLLGIAGSFFNWMLENTVVNFDRVIYGTVASGVQAAWSAFRDISNIVIIGIFTFIALEMILGTQTFGGKKMVAKVLIVAILINFSLLFARIIVESSNFVAGQFYKAVQLQSGSQTAGGSNLNQYSAGISGRFAQMMGVGGVQSTSDALWRAAEKEKNAWIALAQGVLTAIIFVAAAAVFFYAAFLMVARAILLIFLIMVSSLAFASWLLPSSFRGGYGFEGWWKTLLQNAIFGPLVIIMIWATLMVGEGLSRIPGSGKIGGLIENPANPGGVGALFGYLIILGMLFLAIRVSSSFSKGISGFNYAAAFTSAPFAALSRYGVAPVMRNIVGRGAAKRAMELDADIDAEKKVKAATLARGDEYTSGKLARLYRQQASSEALSKRTFDVMNTKTGQLIGKQLGAPGFLSKGSKTNFADSAKASADAAAKTASGSAISKDTAEAAASEKYKTQKAALQQQQKAAKEMEAAAHALAERAKNSEGLGEGIEKEKTALKEATERQAKIREEADVELKKAGLTADQRDTIVRSRDTRLDEQEQRIRDANQRVRKLQDKAVDIEKRSGLHDARSGVSKAETALKNFDNEVKKEAQNILEKDIKQTQELASQIARRSFSGVLATMVGNKDGDVTARMARDLTKKKIKVKGIKEQREIDMDILKGAGEAPSEK